MTATATDFTRAEICGCGYRAAEDLISSVVRVDVSKALDPLDPDDFDVIAGRLASSLSRATEETEAKILRKALQNLDVDWPNISKEQRREVIRAARSTLREIPPAIMPRVNERFEIEGTRVVNGTRESVKRQVGINIGTSLALRDKRISDNLIRSQSAFVTDELGRRRANFSRRARQIVANGLDEGLGRDDIAEQLHKSIGVSASLKRSRDYWDVIAGVHMNRARTFTQLASYKDAGVDSYIFEAVLDERTTVQCRYMHGQVFNVSRGIQQFEASEAAPDPQDVKDIMPWMRKGKDADGNEYIFTKYRDGRTEHVADVVRSGLGNRDDIGVFSRQSGVDRLSALGVTMPPIHGRCRSTIVANV